MMDPYKDCIGCRFRKVFYRGIQSRPSFSVRCEWSGIPADETEGCPKQLLEEFRVRCEWTGIPADKIERCVKLLREAMS